MRASKRAEVVTRSGFGKAKAAGAGAETGDTGHSAPAEPSGFAVPAGRAYNVKTVVATCPHCFNTIKNEYPQLGGNYEVVHHTEFISRLIETGQLSLPAGFDTRKLTYHDPCFIGRWDGIYEEPRRVLTGITGEGVTEMRRNKNRSFCCGGRGGRGWREDTVGQRHQ